ncbi:oligoribonuclease [Vibrio metschnikovii]
MSFSDQNLIWIDLEMTGLDPDVHKIIEIATIVTDESTECIGRRTGVSYSSIRNRVTKMDEWCTRTHTHSGLVDRVRRSSINEVQAIEQTIDFLQHWVPAGASPICGNSVGQDRRFLYRHMPELEVYFHYRCIDVSTIKELTRRWQPEIAAGFSKQGTHLALDDIRESIAELKFYRSHVFKI